MIRDRIYINGEWVKSCDERFLDVINPATGQVIGRIPEGGEDDVDRAVVAARSAFAEWSLTPVEERARLLEILRQGLAARQEELAEIITMELGMPLKQSRQFQVETAIETSQGFADLVRGYPFTEDLGTYRVEREPIGVVACITPWNYPLFQVMAKVAPALAAGCTIVLKPSEVAPLSAFVLAEIIDSTGLPAGVFNLISGRGEPVGEALVADPRVDMVSFTGSTRAGRRIGEVAARTVKRVTMELGGKSPSVILRDADLEEAVRGTVSSCLLNSGQTCNSLTRMLVPEDLHDRAASLAVKTMQGFTPGDPMDDKTLLGPLISATQLERVRTYIRKGIEEGAVLLCGGIEPPQGLEHGFYARPTIFGRVTPGMTVAREEIFGPVLVIQTFRDEEEAVTLANDSEYGLAAAVWSADGNRALKVARRLRAGQVDVNGGSFNLMAPFGGYGRSGNGREMGKFGLEEFLEVKAIQLPC